jgi:hypothetical protein
VTYESKRAHHRSYHTYLFLSLSLSYTIQSRKYMLISRSLHRTIRNISSSNPFNFQIKRSISTKMATSQTATIPQAQRMFDGGTHKLDVWSIFTYVSFSITLDLDPCSPPQFSYSFRQFILLSPAHSHSPRARADTLVPQTSLPTVSTSVKDS